ncbi:bifunctional folylpolyglutamate synthase/dihydrofolate synthase [Sphingobacterium sp. MYb382]|uniref:bifunctional folylpolyglutamate synthase/dihydrofolate synthase n=1 Tax=Sphingobacterium sp. MYb382 TaxID=2745278 RepID=UPI0030B69B4D
MMNTYAAVIEYLYARLPMFTRDGAAAIKKDVDNTLQFCQVLDNPHQKFKSIHIAGTNGKGSSSHMLASIFAAAGYKTALYTSPHLLDFRERIRINGAMIPEAEVVAFINQHKDYIETLEPSFFEVTVAMAFDYFAKEKVDIAIIEVGLGGRLDSTNIIQPEVSLITNIGMDHMNLLGDTLEEIAFEKAGIIKAHTPVVVSENDPKLTSLFTDRAASLDAPLSFAVEHLAVKQVERENGGQVITIEQRATKETKTWFLDLAGSYQQKNILGVLTVVEEMRAQGWKLSDAQVQAGLQAVQTATGLQGRWQTLSEEPRIICDTGHNEDGVREVVKNLALTTFKRLHVVIGAMRDKDLSHMLPLLPNDANYYFCSPTMPRAMPADMLKAQAADLGMHGDVYRTIGDALAAAKAAYAEGDLIFIGGSNFVVAEALAIIQKD